MAGFDADDQDALGKGTGSIVLVGAGNMGGAMLRGWLALGLEPARVAVLDPAPSREVVELSRAGLRLNPVEPVPDAAVVVLAVKPQVAGEVMPRLATWIRPATIVVSVMAGRTLSGIGRAMPQGTAVVRAMPNLPASIGRGMTVAVANSDVTAQQQALVDRFLAAIGSVEWIKEETLLDAVTAVSGSGPAYVFLLAEVLARAGASAGLPATLAERLATATIAGAGAMLQQSTATATTLRENVTSPGGTTAAALAVLMGENALGSLVEKAVAAATIRSRQLSS
jgi:pyrroline-5-carboxylate reductase